MTKISDGQFWKILRENAGLFSRTAMAIEKEYRIKYSRMAVMERAKRKPDQLEDIEQENIDVAEAGLHAIIRSKGYNSTRLRAIEIYLKTKGKHRGYVEKQELDVSGEMSIVWNETKNYDKK